MLLRLAVSCLAILVSLSPRPCTAEEGVAMVIGRIATRTMTMTKATDHVYWTNTDSLNNREYPNTETAISISNRNKDARFDVGSRASVLPPDFSLNASSGRTTANNAGSVFGVACLDSVRACREETFLNAVDKTISFLNEVGVITRFKETGNPRYLKIFAQELLARGERGVLIVYTSNTRSLAGYETKAFWRVGK